MTCIRSSMMGSARLSIRVKRGFNMENKKTIIRVRRGIGDARYCACDDKGNPIRGFNKLSDVRQHWIKEIKWGYVELIRELDKTPDMTTVNDISKMLKTILTAYAKKK